MPYYNINYRVKPSTVREVCDKVRDRASPATVELLGRIHLLHLFELPPFLPNNSLIYELFSCWDVERQGFEIKGKLIKFTVDDVSLIVGLPNQGELLHWENESIAKENSKLISYIFVSPVAKGIVADEKEVKNSKCR